MFQLFRTKFIPKITNSKISSLHTQSLKSNSNPHSPTISYLINKCGLPLTSAISISQILTINKTLKPDSLIQLFKDYNFTQALITTIITKYPKILIRGSVKNLKPKFEFLISSGFSTEDIARLVSAKNGLVCRSLSNHFVPLYNFLRRFLHRNQDVVNAVLSMQYGFVNVSNCLLLAESNVNVLRDHDVPEDLASWLFIWRPKAVTLRNDQFEEIVRVIEGMKFCPHSRSFVQAIGVMGGIRKLDWEKRVETYKSFGMSEEDVITAFKLQPSCMNTSVMRIRKLMGFYMNELGLKPSDLAKHPNLMLISLEKRVIPRCSVLLYLLTNGLIEHNFQLAPMLYSSSKWFENKYVLTYQEVAPDLLKAYHGELECPKWETLRKMLQCVDQISFMYGGNI
ncbi:hypothetical protein ACHQM5_023764 [Ranunculus cassubicifolius]